MRGNGSNPKITIKEGASGGVKGGKTDKMVGVLFSGMKDQDREDLVAGLFRMKIQVGCCGKEYTYNFKTFPREDLKCDCGKKDRWVVKYE